MHYLAFEAKSIQAWITAGGRLRDLAGGSAIVDALASFQEPGHAPTDVVGRIAKHLGVEGRISFSRRAGGALLAMAKDRDDLVMLRAALLIAVSEAAPGLSTVDALIEAESFGAMLAKLPSALQASRARPRSGGPKPGPFIMQSPRTGDAVVRFDKQRGGEAVDAATMAKRKAVDAARAADDLSGVERSFVSVTDQTPELPPVRFPLTIEQDDFDDDADVFPFGDANRTIAVMHADGNRLGSTLIKLGHEIKVKNPAHAPTLFQSLSLAIATATRNAAQTATSKVLIPKADIAHDRGGKAWRVIPARPVVLGGDDLTVILRGDVALDFTEAYLSAFEAETRAALAAVRAEFAKDSAIAAILSDRVVMPDGLSAGAGLAYVGAKQPFADAAELAEQLAKQAKQAAKNIAGSADIPPSTISFLRVTTATLPALSDHIADALTVDMPSGVHLLTASPFVLGETARAGLTPLNAVKAMKAVFNHPSVSSGNLRQYVGKLRTSPTEAAKLYRKWRDTMSRGESSRAQLEQFDRALDMIIQHPVAQNQTPFRKTADSGATARTTVLDALSLVMAEKAA